MATGATTGVVTILVTDQVASTELRARLGDEAADQARRVHTLLLRQALAAAGGTEVKHLGDGILAAFSTPSAALGCAVAIQQGVARHNRRPDVAVTGVRVGLDVGEAVAEDADWFGTVVVVASRLCQQAEAGQILASDLVRRVAGTRGGFEFGPVRALALKGLPEPVAACTVAWAAPEASAVVVPPEVLATASTTFIGRPAELERLQQRWDRARLGQPGLVVVRGDPGIGKTRLVLELGRAAAAAGATVLLGRSEEDSLSPYQPLVDPLRHYVAACPADDLVVDTAATGGDLAHLVPELRLRLVDVPAPALPVDRYRVFEAVAALLRDAARRAPLLVVLDDLQWAEAPALLLLRHLVRHLDDAPALLVATCREEEFAAPTPVADLVDSLQRQHLVEVVTLGGLAEREVASLVHELGGGRSPAGLVRAVYTATEGNPLFVESLLRHLDDNGIPPTGVAGLGLPADMKEVIVRRLARLGEVAQRVLGVASVVGRQFEAGLVARVAGVDDDALVEVLEEAVAARVVAEVAGSVDTYAFHHGVIRQVLYEGLVGLRRAALHRQIGVLLDEAVGPRSPAHLARLAHHFLAASPGGAEHDAAAVSHALAAARAALDGVAYEEAAGLCERALRVLERAPRPDPTRRLDVLLLSGSASCRAGDSELARKAFGLAVAAAETLGTADALTRTALAYSEVPAESGLVDERLVGLLEAAASAVRIDDPRRARLLARLVEELYFTSRRRRCRALCDEAVALARRTGDAVALVDALDVRRLLLVGPGAPEARLAVSEEVVAAAGRTDDVVRVLRGRVARVVDLVEAGRMEGIDAEIEAVAGLAEQARQPAWAWHPAKWRAMRALMAGRIDEAERLAEAALAIGRRPHGKTAQQAYVVQLVEIRRCQGRLGELEGSLATGTTEYRATAAWRCGLAWLLAEVGRSAEAARALAELAADGFAALPDDFTWLTCATALAEVAAGLERAEEAALLHDLLVPYRSQCMFAGQAEMFGGLVTRYLGMLAATLGEWEAAERNLLDALRRAEAWGAGPEAARAELSLARLYRRRAGPGDGARGDAAAGRAAALAHGLGLHALARAALTR